jgi:HK97 gp10 family phage protein
MSSIEGLDEILDELNGLEDEILEAALDGLKKGMKHTVKEARALCPVDTGKLRDSITASAAIRGGQIEASISATAEYAASVEMGSVPQGGAGHGTPARPFMYPAFKMTRGLIVSQVSEAIANQIKGG